MKDHSKIEELTAAAALGGLDEGDLVLLERERSAHGDCEECRRIEAEFGEVAGRLAFGLSPSPVSDTLERRIVAGIRAPKSRKPGKVTRVLGGLAAAALLLVAGGVAGYLAQPSEPTEQIALTSFLAAPGTKISQFEATDGGSLAVAFSPGKSEAFVFGSGLESPPQGKVYELWMIEGDEAPVPGPTFVPEEGSAIERVPLDPSVSDVMAVTIEPEGGSKQPTTDPIYIAEV
ncbi:MAG: anti-sigma factor [Actinomycetota bacterium]